MTPKLFGLPSLALLVALAGCGGGSSSSGSPAPTGTGFGTLTVNWPSRTRLIPNAANSIVVRLKLNGKAVGDPKTISRPEGDAPSTTTTLSNLAYGSYTLDLAAYPTIDGTASDPSTIAQATGTGSMTVTEDTPGVASVKLSSTVTGITVSPVSVDKGKTVDVTVSAKDSDGDIVLLAAGGGSEPVEWSTGSAAVATITGSGPTATLKGVHSGNTTVKATLHGADGSVIASSSPTTVKVNVINDGTGTVTIQ